MYGIRVLAWSGGSVSIHRDSPCVASVSPECLLDTRRMGHDSFISPTARVARRAAAAAVAVLSLGVACASQSGAPSSAEPAPRGPRTLVAVFAHPDDETIVSPALARYAREGARVYVVVATDGRKGVAPHAKIPGGDSLATVRAGEARCSANALGAQPPILLGFEDAGLAVLSPWPGEPLDRLEKRLETTLRELHPDAVITWGAEGGYGHQDHRLVGDVVTQLFQSGAAPASAKLFYPGFLAERIAAAPRWFGARIYPTAPQFLTAHVAYDKRDLAAARRALGCHKSQATEEGMEESFTTLQQIWKGEVAFQQWRGGTATTSLF
jgi:LmbE family N-acetylglucosaminyl deacetylase